MNLSVSMKPQELEDHPFHAGERQYRDRAIYTGGPISKQLNVSVSVKPQELEDHPVDAGEREHCDEAVDTGGPNSQ